MGEPEPCHDVLERAPDLGEIGAEGDRHAEIPLHGVPGLLHIGTRIDDDAVEIEEDEALSPWDEAHGRGLSLRSRSRAVTIPAIRRASCGGV